MKEIATKVDGLDVLTAAEFNPNMTELENIVLTAGITLDEFDLTQLGEAMGKYSASGGFFYTVGGTANALTLTPPSTYTPVPEYFGNMLVMGVATLSTTGASTINVDSIGIVSLVDPDGNAIGKDYIRAGDTFLAMYDSDILKFRIMMLSRVLPYSSIMIYAGAVADIPAGWFLCDGDNGTPDLRNKFVRGAGGAFAPDDEGGANVTGSHILTEDELPAHSHEQTYNNSAARSGGGVNGGSFLRTQETGLTGGGLGHTHDMVPAYYALAYIMQA